jgi:hypothetical protein
MTIYVISYRWIRTGRQNGTSTGTKALRKRKTDQSLHEQQGYRPASLYDACEKLRQSRTYSNFIMECQRSS